MEMLKRNFAIDIRSGSVNEESRTVDLSFSSEEPYKRYDRQLGEYYEVLSHESDDIDMSRVNDGAPVLVNHNPDDHVGVVEHAEVGEDKRGYAKVRFGRSARAIEIFNDVLDGIRKNVSVGYKWLKSEKVGEAEDGLPIVRASFIPFEISLASIPADNSVGVGRTEEIKEEKKDEPLTVIFIEGEL